MLSRKNRRYSKKRKLIKRANIVEGFEKEIKVTGFMGEII